MVTKCHHIVLKFGHSAEVWFSFLHVGLRNTCVHITGIDKKNMSAIFFNLIAKFIDKSGAGSESVLTIFIRPEMSVVIVGVENSQLVGFALGIGAGRRSERQN